MSRSRLSSTFLRTGAAQVALAASLLLVAGSMATAAPGAPTAAAPQRIAASSVDLGSAAGFSVLAGPSITNTGAGTVLALDLGVTGTLAGFPPGTVTGTTHIGDAAVEAAHEDRQAAYDAAAAQTGGTAFSGDQAGKTFTPGLYTTAAAVTNTGAITLDAAGDPSATFVFQVGAALSSAASTKVVLANGALANNVYWQVVGAVSLGANAKWFGTILGAGVVSFGDGASLKGRVLTPSTVALANSPVTKPIDDLVAPVVTINGGPTRSTNDTTASISGTTDEPGTPLVTVTIEGQVLTARAASGAWTMSAGTLTVGTHNVVASVTDPSGNTGTASQLLTVDTSAPVVTIAGGAATATNDVTPTILGTTDEPGTPAVTVLVAGQTLATTAGTDGSWSVDAAALSETSHSVVASVSDLAGNSGTDSQVLTVDVTVPVLTIDGGATRSTSDTSPWTYGTTAEQAGTTVRVSLGGQELVATVQPGGGWGVSAQTLASGTYTVLATVTDAAGNTGTMTQSLQVGSVITDPVVAIDGGAARGTNDPTPTISGTTSVAGNPTVTVTVSGQTLTATADAGSWSVQAATLSEASHTVMASIGVDGSVGTATQVLTVDMSAPTIAIDGGASRSTTDSTPRLQGTTSEAVGASVQVTVGGQSMTAVVRSGGAWGVGADTLAEGTYTVVATITDAAQNSGIALQTLEVAGVAPAPGVTIDGGATRATNDATPTVSGTSDAPVGTAVTVAVSDQTLAATVGAGGRWTAEATVLAEASHTVGASVTDGGTTNTANQTLRVDLTAPAVSIDGGAARTTTDTTPRVQGTTDEQAGTTVQVSVGGQPQSATVMLADAWGVGAQVLAVGTHPVEASVTDAAGNTGTASQTLTIAPVSPPVVPPVVPPVTLPVTPPAPEPTYRPDAEVRVAQGRFVGKGVYVASEQRVTKKLKGRARVATFEVRVTNRGDATDKVVVLGTRRNAKFSVVYLADGKNVTAAVLDGSYETAALRSGESATLVVRVTRAKGVEAGSRTFEIRSTSSHDKQVRDTVRAAVKVG